MSGCGTRIVLRGQKPLALCDRCPCFGSLFPPLAALTFAASSIICAFGLASAAPRSPYRHLELCGIALIWSQEKINEGLASGRIVFTSNGTPRVKRYLDEKEGNVVGDFWIDEEIKPLSANDSERINFKTQKPLCLIERIIKASQVKSEYIILDFFAGS